MKNYDITALYDTYINQYNKSARLNKGAFEAPQTKAEFALNFKEIKAAMKASGEHRLSATQISQRMARDDVYELSLRQARAIKEGLKGAGLEDLSVRKIRGGETPPEFWEYLREQYRNQRNAGVSARDAKMYISTYIFGS